MEFFSKINILLSSNSLYRIIYFSVLVLLILFIKNILTDILIKSVNLNKKINVRKNVNHKLISFIIMITLIYFSTNVLFLSANVKNVINKIYRISLIVSFALCIRNIISPNLRIFKNIKEDKKANTMIDFLIKIIHVIIYIITLLIVINELGYDVNAVIAGIGVGGIVIALGAQEMFKNFFSSISLLLDRAFFIGDWIEIGNVSGIIEEITFRSVKVRTFDNALVNIPNNVIVNENIINWSKMKKRKVKMNLDITYSTTVLKLSKVIEGIRDILLNDENVSNDSIFVNFEDLDNNGYKIMIAYYTTAFQYKEYLEVKEKINYEIVQLLRKEKVEMAYPTKTIYVEKK